MTRPCWSSARVGARPHPRQQLPPKHLNTKSRQTVRAVRTHLQVGEGSLTRRATSGSDSSCACVATTSAGNLATTCVNTGVNNGVNKGVHMRMWVWGTDSEWRQGGRCEGTDLVHPSKTTRQASSNQKQAAAQPYSSSSSTRQQPPARAPAAASPAPAACRSRARTRGWWPGRTGAARAGAWRVV